MYINNIQISNVFIRLDIVLCNLHLNLKHFQHAFLYTDMVNIIFSLQDNERVSTNNSKVLSHKIYFNILLLCYVLGWLNKR